MLAGLIDQGADAGSAPDLTRLRCRIVLFLNPDGFRGDFSFIDSVIHFGGYGFERRSEDFLWKADSTIKVI